MLCCWDGIVLGIIFVKLCIFNSLTVKCVPFVSSQFFLLSYLITDVLKYISAENIIDLRPFIFASDLWCEELDFSE